MGRARRNERREQRQARRQVRRSARQERRSDRRENRAVRREDRAQRIRARGGNIRRADRIDRRAGRSRDRAEISQLRADQARENAEEIIGGTAATMRLESRLLTQADWERFLSALQALKADQDYWDELVSTHQGALEFAHNRTDNYRLGFLTWHRQYLLEFEEDLRQIDNDVRLPYWDWRSRRRVPKHMKVESWMDLNGGRGKAASAVGRKIRLNRIERVDNFEEMSTTLEEIHNKIHGSLGGDMSNPWMSPNDPIFFLHHAFIDKMWDYWQAQNPQIAGDHPFMTMDLPGFPGVTNADVMDNDILGVDYF